MLAKVREAGVSSAAGLSACFFMTPGPTELARSRSQGRQWVVFGPDWGRYPSVSQHLFSQFLGADQILWVETVGLRTPKVTWQDLRRSAQKVLDFVTGRRQVGAPKASGLAIVCPVTLPFTQFRWVRKFNLWQVRRAVRQAMQKLGFQHPTLVVTVPSQCDFVGHLDEGLSVYYCIDQYELWPGMNAAHVRGMESELVAAVGAIVVPSDWLKRRFVGIGKPVLVLEHGVDLIHFQRDREISPADGSVEMVYFGAINERIDLNLLARLAEAFPGATVRLIGPVTVDVSLLTRYSNLIFEGALSYQDLPQAVASADLFLLPFRLDELAQSCSPIKLKEYLACGRAVVATTLHEHDSLQAWIHLEPDTDAFVEWVGQFIKLGCPRPDGDLEQFLGGETWAAKAESLANWLEALKGARATSAVSR